MPLPPIILVMRLSSLTHPPAATGCRDRGAASGRHGDLTMYKPKIWQNFLRYVLLIIWAVIALFPFYWMTTMAFKPKAEWTSAAGKVYWVPEKPTLENFQVVLTEYRGKFFRGNQESGWPSIRSSIVVSVAGTLFALVIGGLAAYGLSRFTAETGEFPWYVALGRLLLLILAMLPFMLI
jgi:multiple sugar transport system permease protein